MKDILPRIQNKYIIYIYIYIYIYILYVYIYTYKKKGKCEGRESNDLYL